MSGRTPRCAVQPPTRNRSPTCCARTTQPPPNESPLQPLWAPRAPEAVVLDGELMTTGTMGWFTVADVLYANGQCLVAKPLARQGGGRRGGIGPGFRRIRTVPHRSENKRIQPK